MAKDTIIVGGSIAGLMCGIMLKHHGYNVTIFEKEPSKSREGYNAGIKIGPDVQDFLKKHSRVPRDFTITCKAPVKFNIDGKAKPEHKQTMTSTSWGLLVSILRADFDGLTSKAVPIAPKAEERDGNAVFRNGAKVTDVRDFGNSVQVDVEDATSHNIQTVSGDLVIVADGSTSTLRKILLPDVKRQYAGYVSWRGTVQEAAVDKQASQTYAEKFAFHLMDRNYILHYTIPTDDGNVDPGKRLHNWIWYQPLAEKSEGMNAIFTDMNGIRHHGTVPRGLLEPKVWEQQKSLASATMPTDLAQILHSTSAPFVCTIYDLLSPRSVFFGGKVLLVGDALTTIRPNAGMSTTHAAYNCNELEKMIEGKQTPYQWEKAVLSFGAAQQRFAMVIASFGLDSKLVMVWYTIRWLLLLLGQKLGLA
ncbi:hypothetical protein BDV96DRAFT_607696 [Lophiotrema nucula]|uniref:2,6-dihydroxypyridine 3-monooxygenase substrate binding domain-containing protein n=1 Tax=Lophiotrema nucula TaxID=690887 RepID=A0A6A5YIT1_9PLEO|nr:hypothetical protein BDV96DRAFT_607696 [Lophiotrema nucula]